MRSTCCCQCGALGEESLGVFVSRMRPKSVQQGLKKGKNLENLSNKFIPHNSTWLLYSITYTCISQRHKSIPHNSTFDSLIPYPTMTTWFHFTCEYWYVHINPHNSTWMKFIPQQLLLFHIITNINFTQFVDKYYSTYAPFCSLQVNLQFHALKCGIMFININSTQSICLFHQKSFVPHNYFLF